MPENEVKSLPTLEQAKAALKKAERAYSRAFGLQAGEVATVALREARETYALVAAVPQKSKGRKERHRSSETMEEES